MSELPRNHLKELARLHRRKGRSERGLFLVEGVRSVLAAVEAGAHLSEILIERELPGDEQLRASLEAAGAPIHVVARKELERISGVQHGQGLMAVAHSMITEAPAGLEGAQTILALDSVQDPGNVGALIRTAAWFGMNVVLAGPGTADFESPKVVRSSMGGLWDIRLVRTDDLGARLELLAQSGLTITGADLGGEPVEEWTPSQEGILVLGSEAHGISEEVRARLDQQVTLHSNRPVEGRGVESLNVAVAGGILMERWLGGSA